MNAPQQSLLTRANTAFRKREFKNAVALYDAALRNSDEPLKSLLQFNRDLAFRRLGATAQATAIALEKPENMEEYYFNLIKEGDFFDPAWYLTQYKEKHQITGNPLAHYLAHGVALSTNPSPHFDTAYYVKTHQDVAASGMHPFLHYVCQGHKEDRPAKAAALDGSLDQYPVEAPQYVPRLAPDAPPFEKAARVIAFYLPQFHPIPENDAWWGKGFTEWTNVKPAKPQFEGHYQPHVPDDFLGYYDLRDTAVMRKQIELAKQYGIEGFCFYTYWFTGHRLLETPVDNYLADPSLDLPFCICWANENWSRRWDGLDSELLMEQHYSPEDDINFITNTAKYLTDPRYIRINGKPLLLIYRPNLFPDMRATAERWRSWCRDNDVGEIYLTYPQSFECVDPALYGFDAACEFPPNNCAPPNITESVTPINDDFGAAVYDWRTFVERSKAYKDPGYKLFRGVTPSWDNTARRKNKGSILLHSTPRGYQEWLYNAINDTLARFANPDERLVFINAWNEWAEGAHLEPDQHYGYAWLETTRMAQVRALTATAIKTDTMAIVIHAFYEDVFDEIIEHLKGVKGVPFKLFVTTPYEQVGSIESTLQSSGLAYHLHPVKNHGRDVLPFLKVTKRIINEGYAYILKIHTKKSKHREDGDIWRHDLYSKLLNEKSIHMALSSFNDNPNLGVIGPSGHLVSMDFYWGSNAQAVEGLAHRLGQTSKQIKSLHFVAGTMFFARMDALLPLLNLAISDANFEPETGQVDGTLAHAIERAISISLAAKSYELTDTDMKRVHRADANYRFVSK